MERMVRVSFRDKIFKDFPAGTTFKEIASYFQEYFNYKILIAKVDNELLSLESELTKKCDVDFYDRSSQVGNSVYNRSLQFIMILAVRRLFGKEKEVVIEHSIDKGIYCEIRDVKLDKEKIKELDKKMKEIIKQDLIFTKVNVMRKDAVKYFKNEKRIDKVKVLKYISNTFINLYRIDDMYDYFYGELANSTSLIDDYKLDYVSENGFVLSAPTIYNPDSTLNYVHHKRLFNEFLDYTKWGRCIGVENAADLNEIVSESKYGELIRLAEAHYEGQLSRIADQIYENRANIRVILLAGPSSSGKTTTAKKLQTYLGSKGIKTYPIGIDDYYVNRVDTPRDENGEYDFESINAIDLKLFNKHLTKLLKGEKIELPHFNFMTGEREYRGKTASLKENEIIIIEGLHALNDELTSAVAKQNKFKIYISPLTQLNIDNHNRIHTSDTRRLRRMIRDSRTRGYTAEETLKRWSKVRAGEEKYIFPFQDSADTIVNSAMIYEIGILKTYAEPLLFSVPEDSEVYPEARRLINFLRNFLPIPADQIPNGSVLREFIGGSCYE
ncbi:MAG: nucleoside kinase [Bacilli bacterium]|nr:nucleoside kinase [Bacilli bacterium]